MRKLKVQHEEVSLSDVVERFFYVKEAQHCSANTLRDYSEHLNRFLKDSNNCIEYDVLEKDVLQYFASIPNTSPARYNKPFQNINALLNRSKQRLAWVALATGANNGLTILTRLGCIELFLALTAVFTATCIGKEPRVLLPEDQV